MKMNISYKKSILLSIGFLFVGTCLKAQDSARIMELLAKKELARAKEAVDSAAITHPSAAVFLLKATVYHAVSTDAAAKNITIDARWEAFQALQKALLSDKEYINSLLEPTNYKIAYDLYDGYTLEGIQYYNAGAERDDKINFTNALSDFKKAAAISQFIYSSKWGKSEVDTLNLYYLSKSAINIEKEEDAVFYSKKIVDNNFIHPALKNFYEIIYQWLVYYYKSRKEAAPFAKYLALAKEQFPLSAYFRLAEMDWLREQRQYPELFKKYKEMLLAEPANSNYRLAYYRDQFMYVWGAGQENKLVNVKALISGLQQLTAGSNQSLVALNAKLLLAKIYINQAQDVTRELMMRSTTDPKISATYKMRYRNSLLLSNKYLKQIAAVKSPQTQSISREAAQLLANNSVALKLK